MVIDYVIVPAGALLALRLDVQRERQSRPAQTKVPAIKGLSYEDAETKLHASNLKLRLLATRYDLPIQPGLIIDQSPQPGEEVGYGYSVGVTVTNADSRRHGPSSLRLLSLCNQRSCGMGLAGQIKRPPWGYEPTALLKRKQLILHRDAATSKIKVFHILLHLLPFSYRRVLSIPATILPQNKGVQ